MNQNGLAESVKRSRKAILLSALVYPGAGHWYLARKGSAVLFMLATSVAFYVLMSSAWSQANMIAEQILSGELQPEIGVLLEQVSQQGSLDQTGKYAMATAWMGMVWLVAVLDTWRIGRQIPSEKNE